MLKLYPLGHYVASLKSTLLYIIHYKRLINNQRSGTEDDHYCGVERLNRDARRMRVADVSASTQKEMRL
jgi:hypothetical protein